MRRRTYLLWKRLLTRLLALLAVCATFYGLFVSGIFTITSYEFDGVPYEYRAGLSDTFTSLAGEKILWIFPGNRVFSYHRKAMRRELLAVLPNSKSVSIRSTGLHTVFIKVEPYTPAFAMENGYALSKEGTVYKEVGSTFGLPAITLASTTKVTASDIEAISSFNEKIGAVLFEVVRVSIDEHDDIRFYDKGGSYVTANGTGNLQHAWSNIVSALDTEPLKGKLSQGISSLEYIDARFGNKVFYKFTTGTNSAIIPKIETNASSTASTTVQ